MLRRARGLLLRLVRRRAAAIVVGFMLVVPAIWIEASGQFDAWWADGVALVLGATGAAIIWTGLFGLRPDYIDREN